MDKDIWNYFEITLHVLGETGLTAIKRDKTGYTEHVKFHFLFQILRLF